MLTGVKSPMCLIKTADHENDWLLTSFQLHSHLSKHAALIRVSHNGKPNERNHYVVAFAKVISLTSLFTSLLSHQQMYTTSRLVHTKVFFYRVRKQSIGQGPSWRTHYASGKATCASAKVRSVGTFIFGRIEVAMKVTSRKRGLVDGRLGSRSRGYHPVAHRPLRYEPFVHRL
jgi:hypothetical protein